MKLPEEVILKIKSDIKDKLSTSQLAEGYVAQVKPIKQVTEFSSQKTKDSHEAIYRNCVAKLNETVAKLEGANKSDSDNFSQLKRLEVKYLNGVWLHELFFTGSFDPHSEIVMDSKAFIRIQRDFGTFDDWQRDFMAMATSGGNGWAIMGFHPYLKQYRNFFIENDEITIPAGMIPVIVVDMWEHAYSRDYGTDKISYVTSQLRQVNWKVIEDRVEKCEVVGRTFANGFLSVYVKNGQTSQRR